MIEIIGDLSNINSKTEVLTYLLNCCRYDFDGDGLITREDIRIILSYLPLKSSESLATAIQSGKNKIINLHAAGTIGTIPEDEGDNESGASPSKSLSFTEVMRKNGGSRGLQRGR